MYSLWSMRWAFTRSSETVKQPVLFYALVWFSLARGPHTLTRRGKSPFHPLRSRCFVSAWVLDLRENTGWFTVEKVPFLWSTIYPANFGKKKNKNKNKKIGHLELIQGWIQNFTWVICTNLTRGVWGVLPQENLKFSVLRMQFSCILRAPQAIQTHKQHLLRKAWFCTKIHTGGSVERTI